MIKIVQQIFLFSFLFYGSLGHSATISLAERKECAMKFHEAFILQSVGQSTQAFFLFQSAFQQGLQIGESPKNLQAIANIFYWYRKYGSHLDLFAVDLDGKEVITDSYKGTNCKYRTKTSNHRNAKPPKKSDNPNAIGQAACPLGAVPNYSEWGNNPKQAAQIRNLMFGIGEIISAIFIFSVTSPIIGWTALPTIGYDGATRIFNSLNELWTDHEMEMMELRQLTDQAVQLGKM